MNTQKLLVSIYNVSPKTARFIGNQRLSLHKNRPHIMFAAGMTGMVVSTVLACRATLKLSDTLDEIQSDIAEVKDLGKGQGNYPTEENGRDLAYVYARSALRLAKLYGPSVGLGLVSASAISGAHIDLTKRNTAMLAAYAALESQFASYRDRVAGDVGDARELDIYQGLVDSKDEESGELVKLRDPNGMSPYARFFDEYSAHFTKDPEMNRMYIHCQQQYANELLRARGHVFLNDVYDMLGIERSRAGAVVGWLMGKDGDNYIDFGMYDPTNSPFINGIEKSVLLDFNVDGVVYDKI